MLLRRVRIARRHLSSDSVDSVRVGRAVTRLRNGGDFKPVGALATLPPRLGATLEWLCQKDALGQDALLICAPAERARLHIRPSLGPCPGENARERHPRAGRFREKIIIVRVSGVGCIIARMK